MQRRAQCMHSAAVLSEQYRHSGQAESCFAVRQGRMVSAAFCIACSPQMIISARSNSNLMRLSMCVPQVVFTRQPRVARVCAFSGVMSGGADRQQKAQKPSLRAARLSQSCRKRLVLWTSTALRQFLSDSCTAQSCSPGTSVSVTILRQLAAGDSTLHG